MKTYTVKFDINDKVLINEINITGTIVGIYIGHQCMEYRVRYFDNCTPQTEYFYSHELIEINDTQVKFNDSGTFGGDK